MPVSSEAFIQAIRDKKKVRITFYSKDDDGNITRLCAPMDYGPSRIAHQKNNRYHSWDYESDKRNHTLSLSPEQVRSIEVLDDSFDPAEFMTWTPNWIIPRDWGRYS